MFTRFPAKIPLIPRTSGEIRRWLLVLTVSIVLGVIQAAALSYHTLYEFAPYPIPYTIVLTFAVGALWYRWTTTVRETVASFAVLIGTSATVLIIVFTAPSRALDRPAVDDFPIVERVPFGEPADVILQVAGFRTFLLLFLAVPLLIITAVILRVLHSESTVVEQRLAERGSVSLILIVATVVMFLLAGGMLTGITGNYVSVVDQNGSSITAEDVAVDDNQVTVLVTFPNNLNAQMRVQDVELFLYVDDNGWETTTATINTTVPAGETEQITVTYPVSDLDSELVCNADQVRVDGLISIRAFDHYAETFPVSETTIESSDIACN